MKAWQFTSATGGLEKSLYLTHTAQKPSSLPSQSALVEVLSAALNPIDFKIAELPIISRLVYGSPASPGIDFCGRVVASNAHEFQEGQKVFGRLDRPNKFGTLGQFITAGKETAALPDGVDADDAAAVGTAGTTSYQCLKIGGARPGSKVFINGGSGGTGTWGIQFAKVMGSHVTTSSSTRNIELCKSLGADEVIDYTKEDLIEKLKSKGQCFDLVVDNIGSPGRLYREADHFLKPDGKFIQVGVPMNATAIFNLLRRKWWPASLGNGSRTWIFHDVYSSHQDLEQIGEWLAERKVKAVIDRTFPWENAPEAYKRLKTGKAQGKIVVHVESQEKM